MAPQLQRYRERVCNAFQDMAVAASKLCKVSAEELSEQLHESCGTATEHPNTVQYNGALRTLSRGAVIRDGLSPLHAACMQTCQVQRRPVEYAKAAKLLEKKYQLKLELRADYGTCCAARGRVRFWPR